MPLGPDAMEANGRETVRVPGRKSNVLGVEIRRLSGCGKSGVQKGEAPFPGGLGLSHRYNFPPFLARKGARGMVERAFQYPAIALETIEVEWCAGNAGAARKYSRRFI